MRIMVLILASALSLMACVSPEDGNDVDETGGGGGEGRGELPSDADWAPASPKPGLCEMTESYGKGGMMVELPVPCDPYWVDKGRPPEAMAVNPDHHDVTHAYEAPIQAGGK